MTRDHKTIVITTINQPTEAIRKIASTCQDWTFLVIGDRKTPADWAWPGVKFVSAAEQLQTGGEFAAECPFNHYARKNVGYLWAIGQGAELIAETDDDNIPYDSFLQGVSREVQGRRALKTGWENVYTHFTGDKIWPRGFPLELITESLKAKSELGEAATFDCPVQQYLADGDPDVDAVYRLTIEAQTKFQSNTVVLSKGTYCPFNSQNTIFWPEAYPLLYLPAYVSFRMTDIWRSFIAEVCLYAMDKSIAFRDATVFQERNQHSLIRDFADEVPGYLNNTKIIEILNSLSLSSDPAATGDNLWKCYDALVGAGIVPPKEMKLVELWLRAVSSPGSGAPE
ncbi:MAG: hypothetical protein JWO80_5488 [Bryobacterales bacterium]|nr:hypothetical protein [Bryobacterales bacterium]